MGAKSIRGLTWETSRAVKSFKSKKPLVRALLKVISGNWYGFRKEPPGRGLFVMKTSLLFVLFGLGVIVGVGLSWGLNWLAR